MSIVISFPFPFHLHRHLICRSLKRPRCCGACVCVNHLKGCKTSKFRRGHMGTWMARANEDPSKFLCKRTCNFWIVMGCGQPKNHYAVFQWESHQDFWIQHMNGWRWLLISLSSQLAQSETAVNLLSIPVFCWYFGVSPGFYWFYSILQGGDERIFLSVHTKHPPVPVRCNWIVFARQMRSTTEFSMTVLSKFCVCACIYCTLNFLKGKLPTTAYLTWNTFDDGIHIWMQSFLLANYSKFQDSR